jgi:glycine/D-amino acid oxidase-like deaminating enzyme
VEHVGFERDVKPEIVAKLAADAGAILPHLSETTPSESWIGFRPGSDALHVGPWHSESFYLAYGHFRNGILLAPWTASLLSSAIASSLGTP